MNKIIRFEDIPRFTPWGNYSIDVGLDFFVKWLNDHQVNDCLDLEPDFQRIHVWTTQQKIEYMEFILRGGKSGNVLLFNCPGWMNDFRGPFELIDGKQRISAVLGFFNNEFPVFGSFFREFEDKIRRVNFHFKVVVNNLETRKEVLQWYLDINSGGTPHTKEEIERIKSLLKYCED